MSKPLAMRSNWRRWNCHPEKAGSLRLRNGLYVIATSGIIIGKNNDVWKWLDLDLDQDVDD
jgi:hypothetical protein